MDTITAITGILFLSWTIAIVISGTRKPIPSLSAAIGETQEQELVFSEQTEEQKREEIPQKPIQRGKFPAFVDKLSERELFDRLKAALDGRLGEAIKIGSAGFHGGETFWLPGHRIGKEFTYSHDGTDLYPVTVYYS